jgi:hypothetical protein
MASSPRPNVPLLGCEKRRLARTAKGSYSRSQRARIRSRGGNGPPQSSHGSSRQIGPRPKRPLSPYHATIHVFHGMQPPPSLTSASGDPGLRQLPPMGKFLPGPFEPPHSHPVDASPAIPIYHTTTFPLPHDLPTIDAQFTDPTARSSAG